MNSLLEDLLASLDREAEIYQDLLLLLQREKQVLAGPTLQDLDECNREKETLICKAGTLGETRRLLLEKLAEELKIPFEELTLRRLGGMIKEPFSHEVKSRRSTLLSLFHSIRETNEFNESLINHSLNCVTGSLSLLSNLVSSGSTYLDTGHIRARNNELLRGRI